MSVHFGACFMCFRRVRNECQVNGSRLMFEAQGLRDGVCFKSVER